jgi:hypothetical protein
MRKTLAFCVTLLAVAAFLLSLYNLRQARNEAAARDEVAARLSELRSSLDFKGYADEQNARTLAAIAGGAHLPWGASDDGKVGVRLLCDKPITLPNLSMLLIIEVRNNTAGVLGVDAPRLGPSNLWLHHDGRRIPYAGSSKCGVSSAPIPLPPGGVYRQVVELTPAMFPVLSQKGSFAAEYTYTSGASGGDTWAGKAGPVTTAWVSR